MLDGLLGRGFASKCKSLIKATKARIELIRKKRIAMEKFLKKDIADLLAKGLDINAYGRTDGLMAELILSSCYDFVEHCCDLLYKQLSAMQNQSVYINMKSECPAECKAAVASLMFAAARFSDLPELRDLRETFQEKYGNSLQYSVNQKFADDLSPPSPTRENKIQLMQYIAAEYSISWNSKAFEKQMAKPPAHAQELSSRYGSVPVKDKSKADGGNLVDEKDKNYILSKVNYKLTSDQNGSRARNGDGNGEEIKLQSLGRRDIYSNGQMPHKVGDDKGTRRTDDDPKSLKVKESHLYKHQAQSITHGTTETVNEVGRYSYGRERDSIHREYELQDKREVSIPKREMPQALSLEKQVIHPSTERLKVPGGNKDKSANVPNGGKLQDAHKMIPPPYVRPPKAVKAEKDSDLKYTGFIGGVAGKSTRDMASQLQSSHSNKADESLYGLHHIKYEKESSGFSKGMRDGRDAIHMDRDDSVSDLSLPKPKSVRRRHSSQLSSSHDDDVIGTLESSNMEKERSNSRTRRDTKRGQHRVSGEEKALDKLLIHLSTKPANMDPPEKLRRKSQLQAPHQIPSDIRPHKVENKVKPGNVSPLAPHSRSVSLPHEQSVPPEPVKVFARAASFQPATHVHPNLPDCDDLAARMADLRSSY